MEEEIKIKKPNRKKPIIIISVIAIVALIIIIVAATSGNSPIPSGKIGDSLVNSDGVTFKVDKVEDTKRIGDTYHINCNKHIKKDANDLWHLHRFI